MTSNLHDYLNATPPGPITDTGTLARLLADAWAEFSGDDGGMVPHKHLTRMEDVACNPPLLTFTIVLGATGATVQEWTVDLEKRTVTCIEARYRQLRPIQPRVDVAAVAEEIVAQVVNRRHDHRLKWYADGRVRVLVGRVLPEESAVKQSLAARRKRLRATVRECGVNVYEP